MSSFQTSTIQKFPAMILSLLAFGVGIAGLISQQLSSPAQASNSSDVPVIEQQRDPDALARDASAPSSFTEVSVEPVSDSLEVSVSPAPSSISAPVLVVEEEKPREVFERIGIAVLRIQAIDQQWEFRVPVEAGDTVEIWMRRSESQGVKIAWEAYVGLGAFVQALMDIESKNGSYWIYSLNGNVANNGVGKRTIAPDDVIEWKYE